MRRNVSKSGDYAKEDNIRNQYLKALSENLSVGGNLCKYFDSNWCNRFFCNERGMLLFGALIKGR